MPALPDASKIIYALAMSNASADIRKCNWMCELSCINIVFDLDQGKRVRVWLTLHNNKL